MLVISKIDNGSDAITNELTSSESNIAITKANINLTIKIIGLIEYRFPPGLDIGESLAPRSEFALVCTKPGHTTLKQPVDKLESCC